MDANTVAELMHRVSLLERKVAHLYEIAQREEPDFDSTAVSDEVVALVQQNRIIEAVKLHRELTGLGLAEAKAAIDSVSPTG